MPFVLFDSPVSLLAVLAALSILVRLLLLKPSPPPTAAGAPVMAVGIWVLGTMLYSPAEMSPWERGFALELLVVWAYVAGGLAVSLFRRTFAAHLQDTVGSFAIGTWVAGTAVLARLLYIALPEWRYLAELLGWVALLLWLGYLPLVVSGFNRLFAAPNAFRVTGRILLSTVSTQSLLVLWETLYPGQVPSLVALGVIGLGLLFYLLGFALLAHRFFVQRTLRLADDWDSTNCILHGAMSITGLAAVESGVVSAQLILLIWLWAASMLVAVEAIEIARAWTRVRAYGLRRGLLAYDVSQWARNFTFGMFYTFTVSLGVSGLALRTELPAVRILQVAVIDWGQFVVLFFLVVELGIFLMHNLSARARRAIDGVPFLLISARE